MPQPKGYIPRWQGPGQSSSGSGQSLGPFFLLSTALLGQEPASASSGLLLGSPAPPLPTDYIAQASWGPGVSTVIPGDVLRPAGVEKSQQVAFRSWLPSMNTIGQVRVSHEGATAAKRTARATAGAEATVRLSAMNAL